MVPPGLSNETSCFLISGGKAMRYTMGWWLANGSAGSALGAVLLADVSASHGVHAADSWDGEDIGGGDGDASAMVDVLGCRVM